MSSKNENGFSVIEVLIGVAIAIVLVGTSLLVFHKHNHTKLSATNVSHTSTSPSSSTAKNKTTTSSTSTTTTTKSTSAPKASTPPASNPNNVAASTIIAQFNTAAATGDQATVRSLESSLFIQSLQSQEQGEGLGNTDNFYVFCQESGYSCTNIFTPSHLSTASVTTSTAANPNGVTDTVESFTENYSNNGSTVSLSFAVYATPNGNSWLIDRVDLSGN